MARAYLDTQRIRMGRSLRFEIPIPEDLRAAAFPPMMLLPLVENAIKHGLNPRRAGGSIRIVAESTHGSVMRITVADTGAGFSTVELGAGSGIGLSNIRSRLTALYGGRARLTFGGNMPHGVVATLEVPLRIDAGDTTGGDGRRATRTVTDARALNTFA